MNTMTIQTFLVVAEVGNFTHAASQLFVSQPTVTSRIQDLEEELGVPLFTRGHRQVRLTEAGIQFQEFARQFLELETRTKQALQETQKQGETIRFGVTNMIYELCAARRLQDFLQAHPEASLQLSLNRTDFLLEKLKSGLLDGALTFAPLREPGFLCRTYFTQPLILVTAWGNQDHAAGINRRELGSLPYLYCNYTNLDSGLFLRSLFPLHQRFLLEIDNSTKLLEFIKQGIGYTFLPEKLVREPIQKEEIRSIPLLDFSVPQVRGYCITRKDHPLPVDFEEALWEKKSEEGRVQSFGR